MTEFLQSLNLAPMVVIKVLTISLGLFIMLLTLEMIRRDLLRTAYALIWLLTGLVIAIVGLWPNFFLTALINLTGMNYQTAMLFIVFGFMLVLLMQYSIIISRLSNRNKHLAQDVAILRQQVTQHLGLEQGNPPAAQSRERATPGASQTTDGQAADQAEAE